MDSSYLWLLRLVGQEVIVFPDRVFHVELNLATIPVLCGLYAKWETFHRLSMSQVLFILWYG